MDLVISSLLCVLQSDSVELGPPSESSDCAVATFRSWLTLCGAALLLLLSNTQTKIILTSNVRKNQADSKSKPK